MTRDADGQPDFEPVDDNGLTAAESRAWRATYTATAELIQIAVTTSPTPAEAQRRIGLLMLELRTSSAAVEMCAIDWTKPRSDSTAATKDPAHG